MVMQKTKMTVGEVEGYKHGLAVEKVMMKVAERTYHPAGYGFYGKAEIIEEDGVYYAKWLRGSSCG